MNDQSPPDVPAAPPEPTTWKDAKKLRPPRGRGRRVSRTGRSLTIVGDRLLTLLRELEEGQTYQVACVRAGVGQATFFRYLERGARPRAHRYFREFRELVIRAETEGEAKLVERWLGHGDKDWRAVRDYLERRHRDRWRPPRVEAHHSGLPEPSVAPVAVIQIISHVPRPERPAEPPPTLTERRLQLMPGGKDPTAEVAG